MINKSCVHDVSDEDTYKCFKHGYRVNCYNCPDFLHERDWGKLMMMKMTETKRKSAKWTDYCTHRDECIDCPHIDKCKEELLCSK